MTTTIDLLSCTVGKNNFFPIFFKITAPNTYSKKTFFKKVNCWKIYLRFDVKDSIKLQCYITWRRQDQGGQVDTWQMDECKCKSSVMNGPPKHRLWHDKCLVLINQVVSPGIRADWFKCSRLWSSSIPLKSYQRSCQKQVCFVGKFDFQKKVKKLH